MRLLPSGTTAVLVEVDDPGEVLAMYAALAADPPPGLVDLVPATRTVLVVVDPAVTSLAVTRDWLRRVTPAPAGAVVGELVEVAVTYDGADLADVAAALGCDVGEVVRRHTAARWSVVFVGFAPGFGYLVSPDWPWAVPRRPSPRTRVPGGAVALAGTSSAVYPRASPGGWQLIGRTTTPMFDLAREPAALLRAGTRVCFVEVDAG